MSAPSVELQAPHPGYIERRAVANLAASLTRRGFEVSVKATPAGVRYSTPWNVLLITLDHVADAAGVAAVVASAIGWAKRRWRRGNDINDTYFIRLRTANSRKVRRILIEDGEVHELKSQKEQDEAFLSLRQVIKIISSSSPDWKKTPVTCELEDGALRECLVSTLDLSRVVLVPGPPLDDAKYVLGPVIVDAADVARAKAAYEVQFDVGWSVEVHLTSEGAKAFYRATLAAVGATSPQDQIAFIVDGEIVSSPHVVQPIRSGNLVITGGFSEGEAKALAASVPPFN
jgi:SecDF, P1 head subdomain